MVIGVEIPLDPQTFVTTIAGIGDPEKDSAGPHYRGAKHGGRIVGCTKGILKNRPHAYTLSDFWT
jgi:hypothetical protein